MAPHFRLGWASPYGCCWFLYINPSELPEAAVCAVHPSPLQYAYAVGVGRAPSCAEAAVAVLTDVMRRVGRHADEVDGVLGEELAFQASSAEGLALGWCT